MENSLYEPARNLLYFKYLTQLCKLPIVYNKHPKLSDLSELFFWVMTLCRLVGRYQSPGEASVSSPENEGSMFLRNVGIYLVTTQNSGFCITVETSHPRSRWSIHFAVLFRCTASNRNYTSWSCDGHSQSVSQSASQSCYWACTVKRVQQITYSVAAARRKRMNRFKWSRLKKRGNRLTGKEVIFT
jgi:hypothetical protein